jgi:hypothetical protein
MVTTEPNAGFAAGIGQRSRKDRLAWALKGAPLRKKDLRLNALTGIAECRKLRDRVTTMMTAADANPEDAIVFCVFAEPDLSALAPEMAIVGLQNGVSDLKLASQYIEKLPIGFLVFVRDLADHQQSIFGHARPLIVEDPRSIELNQRALLLFGHSIQERLKAGQS